VSLKTYCGELARLKVRLLANGSLSDDGRFNSCGVYGTGEIVAAHEAGVVGRKRRRNSTWRQPSSNHSSRVHGVNNFRVTGE
jgi:hypothetical protein